MGKLIDETGNIYGKLKVLERAQGKNPKVVYWLCECECGNKTIVAGSSLRGGKTKSCGKCIRSDVIDETGNVYGKLTVIGKSANPKTNVLTGAVWTCQCECGAILDICGTILRRENGPKACRSCSQKINWVGKHFGLLTVIEELPNNQYKCKCDCGNTIIMSGKEIRREHRLSCGCLKSIGEGVILNILNNNNIQYKQQKIFNTCRNPETNAYLYFDFYLPQYNCLIEYDGGYHYFGWLKDEESKEKTQFRDSFKNQWCQNNNISLIRIPYTHLNDICLEDLLPKTSKFLIGGN